MGGFKIIIEAFHGAFTHKISRINLLLFKLTTDILSVRKEFSAITKKLRSKCVRKY